MSSWSWPSRLVTGETSTTSCLRSKRPCGIYEIESESGRLSYKIFADDGDLRLYLKRNKGKACHGMSPVFIVDEYREYAGTQVRKLTPDEIERYMSGR